MLMLFLHCVIHEHASLQVEQQVNDVLARILPEGVTLPTEQQQPLPTEEEEEFYWVDKVDDDEWEEEEQGELEGVGA